VIDLELFSCAGGMAEGFRRAGLVFDLAIDADPAACDSYEANLGHRPVQIDARDLVRLAKLGAFAPEVRLLVADPPCTPWSIAGKRLGLADERDMLRVTCDLIAAFRPRAYLIGNIPGLETHPNLGAVQSTIGALEQHGYCVADAVTLDAADYGVPQHRVRPFWYGHLAGPCLRWPSPTHEDPKLPALPGFNLEAWVTCREALRHLGPDEIGRVVRGRRGPPNPGCGSPSKVDGPARTVRTRQNDDLGDKRIRIPQSARELESDVPAPTVQATETRNARATALASWPWDRPATTIECDERLEMPGQRGPSRKTTGGHVRLSERAAAILQGFPEAWRFVAKRKKTRWSMIGQAVPPPLAEAVARSVVEQLERTDATKRATP
jgi:DNA (cytosine-5)-methyltransferase 1